MDCPRCGRHLTTITIAGGDGEAVYCERCRYAGVSSEFESDPDTRESWAEALDRFRGANAARSDSSEGDGDSSEGDGDDGGR